jgi:hypothetical protein
MKLFSSLVALLIGTMLAMPLKAQTVHAILVGDTQDASIGVGVVSNLNKIRAFLKAAQDEGMFTVNIAEVKDDAFSCGSILQAIRALHADANDTIFFYYAGHGFRRTETQTQFPEFDCRRSAAIDRADLSGIAHYLLKPNGRDAGATPRLLIAIADTCNVLIEEQVPHQARRNPAYARINRQAQFRQLFLQYSGTLIMSGSSPGDPSWYLSSGGYFTSQFLNALNAHLDSVDTARWEGVATDATKQIFIPTTTPTYQKPQYAPSNLQLETSN